MEDNNTAQQTPAQVPTQPAQNVGQREWLVALILSVLLGSLGVDRFYMGLIGTGILKLITAGGCGVWYIIDIVLIASNTLKDKNGHVDKSKFSKHSRSSNASVTSNSLCINNYSYLSN